MQENSERDSCSVALKFFIKFRHAKSTSSFHPAALAEMDLQNWFFSLASTW